MSTLHELINQLKNRESIKCETIILIGPDMASQKKQLADENIVGAIDNMVKFMSVKDIGNTLVKLVDMKKKEIYEIALLRKKKCK